MIRTSSAIFFIVVLSSGAIAVTDDDHVSETSHTESDDGPNGIKTLGGMQFWGDLKFFQGWRIQQHVLTHHYRLLDPHDHRHCSGTVSECEARLLEIAAEEKLPAMSGRAAVLIHGIGRSSKSFDAMAKALQKDGYTVVSFDYPSTRVPIQDSAEYLHRVLESLDGIESIDIVVHSMGGLVLRSYLQKHNDTRLHRAVMLGVPNNGAQVADFLKNNPVFKMILGPAGQQLVTESDGLISSLPAPDFEFGVLAGGRGAAKGYNPLLPGDNDSTVTVASTRLPGARDFICIPVIHSFLMSDQKAITATRCFLKHGQFEKDRVPDPIGKNEITVIE
ncbi:MAG TPA: alpha/beta fold hydrolase [Planctomycetes bacterium]|nr:alpha/beta fold hydrolase [Planctomycetota bacterium]